MHSEASKLIWGQGQGMHKAMTDRKWRRENKHGNLIDGKATGYNIEGYRSLYFLKHTDGDICFRQQRAWLACQMRDEGYIRYFYILCESTTQAILLFSVLT